MDLPVDRASSSSSAEPSANEPVVRTDRRVLLNTSALAGSSLWRIGLSFVLQLFIANRLGAVGLGQYTTALAYLNVCQILSELGLPQLLVRDLARQPGQKRRSFQLALTLQIGAALLVWGALSALVWLLPFQADTRLALIVITASLPLHAVTSVCTTLFQASERMEVVMLVEMVVNTLIVGISLWVLWQGGTVVHMAAVLIGTQAVSVSLYLWLLQRSKIVARGDFGRTDLSFWQALWGIQRQARPFYGISLANVLLQRLDILLLSAFVGEKATGVYSAAYLVVRVLLIFSQTYWQALYPTLSRLQQQAATQAWRLATLGLRFGLMLLLLFSAISSSLADLLFGVVFPGEPYMQAIPVFRVLIWAPPFFLIASFAVNLLLVERRPLIGLWVIVVHLLVTLSLLPLFSTNWGALGAAYAVLVAYIGSAVVGLFLVYRAQIPIEVPLRWSVLGLATLSVVIVFHLLSILNADIWPLSIVVAGVLYFGVLWQSSLLSVQDFLLFRRALGR